LSFENRALGYLLLSSVPISDTPRAMGAPITITKNEPANSG
jgi:hypothetical protein